MENPTTSQPDLNSGNEEAILHDSTAEEQRNDESKNSSLPIHTGNDSYMNEANQEGISTGRGFIGEIYAGEDRRNSSKVDETGFLKVEKIRGYKIADFATGFGRKYALTEDGEFLNLKSEDAEEKSFEIDVIFKQAAWGHGFGAAIGLKDSRLYTWGMGDQGQLGIGHSRGSSVPEVVRAVSDKTFQQVSCGQFHAAAVTEQGEVYTWGRGLEGQLGQGVSKTPNLRQNPHMSFRFVPRLVQSLIRTTIVQISCGNCFTAAICDQGAIWTWGEGQMGQLGTGRCTMRSVPAIAAGQARENYSSKKKQKQPEETETPEDYADILPDGYLDSKEETKTEEDAIEEKQSEAKQEESEANKKKSRGFFVEVSCGWAHVLALDAEENMVAWGANQYGQLGLGDFKTRFLPENVAFDKGSSIISSISVDKHTSALLTAEGTVYTWGLIRNNVPTAEEKVEEEPVQVYCRPQKVEGLDGKVEMMSVSGKDVLAMIPTSVTGITPELGSIRGGTKLLLNGGGLWPSENIKVKFIPILEIQENNKENEELEDESSETHSNFSDSEDEFNYDETSSLDSGSSEESKLEVPQDPRTVKVVNGIYNEGCVECITPDFEVLGKVQVEVSMDGKNFTNNGMLFTYVEELCVTKVEPSQFCYTAETADHAEITFRVYCSNLIQTRSLCLRFSSHANVEGEEARTLEIPSTLRYIPDDEEKENEEKENEEKGNEEEEEEEEEEKEKVEIQVMEAKVNASQLYEALSITDGEPGLIQAYISASLNKYDFSQVEESHICTISNLSICSCSPTNFLCCSDSEDTIINSNLTVLVNGYMETEEKINAKLSFLNEEQDALEFEGEVSKYNEETKETILSFKTPSVRIDMLSNITSNNPKGEKALVENKEEENAEEKNELDNEEEQDIEGYVESNFKLTLNGGESWAHFDQPIVFYSGKLNKPNTKWIPWTGCCEFKLQSGWVFSDCRPLFKFSCGGDESLVASGCVEAHTSISCLVPDLSVIVEEYMSNQKEKITEEVIKSIQENDEDKSEDDQEEIDNQLAEKLINEKLNMISRIDLNVEVSLNEIDFNFRLDELHLYKPPSLQNILPENIELPVPVVAENQEEVEDQDIEVTITGAGVIETGEISVKFCLQPSGDVKPVFVTNGTLLEPPEDANEESADAGAMQIKCSIPMSWIVSNFTFTTEPVLHIFAALNGVDFLPAGKIELSQAEGS